MLLGLINRRRLKYIAVDNSVSLNSLGGNYKRRFIMYHVSKIISLPALFLIPILYSAPLVFNSSAVEAAPICICSFDPERGTWKCNPPGCWMKQNVPKLGEMVAPNLGSKTLPKQIPRTNPKLIIPKKPLN